jgi:hypothetical protein
LKKGIISMKGHSPEMLTLLANSALHTDLRSFFVYGSFRLVTPAWVPAIHERGECFPVDYATTGYCSYVATPEPICEEKRRDYGLVLLSVPARFPDDVVQGVPDRRLFFQVMRHPRLGLLRGALAHLRDEHGSALRQVSRVDVLSHQQGFLIDHWLVVCVSPEKHQLDPDDFQSYRLHDESDPTCPCEYCHPSQSVILDASCSRHHPGGWRCSPCTRERAETSMSLDELLLQKARTPRPLVYCLCGSTSKAAWAFQAEHLRLTLAGYLVHSIGANAADEELGITSQQKEQLDVLHLFKIEQADIVRILNVGGYLGESTRRELEYARRLGKPIEFLEEPQAAHAEPWRGLSEEADALKYQARLWAQGSEGADPELVAEQERAATLADELGCSFPNEPGPRYVIRPCDGAGQHGDDCYSVFRADDPNDCVQAHVAYTEAYYVLYGVYPPSDLDETDCEVQV